LAASIKLDLKVMKAMKGMTQRRLIFVFGILLSSSAVVHAEGFYGGLGFGKVQTSLDSGGTGGTATTSRKSGTGTKYYGGYEVTKHWGVEGGYVDLGESKDIWNTSNFATYRFTSMYLAGVGSLPIGDRFTVFAKAGMATNRNTGTFTSFGVGSGFEGRKTTLMYGIGANLSFTKNLAARLEYEDFGSVTSHTGGARSFDGKGRMFSISLNFVF
jgi:OOP family OmpA-OmpF porin